MLDWLIIGGGIHGCLIANALLDYGGVPSGSLAILDPHGDPLAVWNRRTAACGMRYLRSPAAHAVVPNFTALLGWARRHSYDPGEHTIPPYARPSLELFSAHARAMIEASGLRSRWVHGRATAIERTADGWRVRGPDAITARNVVLALGHSDEVRVPEWAIGVAGVSHVFDPGFDRDAALRAERPVVIGGGVSAVHLALYLAERGRRTRIITRHPLRVRQFDSDPCYIGPACMRDFLAQSDPEQRRETLDRVRNPGSIPQDLQRELAAARESGRVEVVCDAVQTARAYANGVLLCGREEYTSDRVLLATGFSPAPPGRELLAPLVAGSATGPALPVDSVGFPIPDHSLQWTPGLFVTGRLAEQELGPSAPNIIGGHNAAKRMISDRAGKARLVPASWRRYAPARLSSSSGSAVSNSC